MKTIKHIGLLVFAMLLLATGCEKLDLPKGTPTFVRNKIIALQSKPAYNPPAEVYEWEFKGMRFYYFTPDCCDQWSELFDSVGNLVCHPDGGITGTGDGKCPDFSSGTLTKTLIWKDDRK